MDNNIFDFLSEPIVPTTMSKDEWIKKAKLVLTEIAQEYGRSHFNRVITKEQIPDESICEKCTGCGTTTDGLDCTMDREYGDCFVRIFDQDQFQEVCEGKMDDIFELLSIDKIEG